MTIEERNAIQHLGVKIDTGMGELFGRIDEVKDSVAELKTEFAVHIEGAKAETEKLATIEKVITDISPVISAIRGRQNRIQLAEQSLLSGGLKEVGRCVVMAIVFYIVSVFGRHEARMSEPANTPPPASSNR